MTLHVHISGDSHSWILSRGAAGLAAEGQAPPERDFSMEPMGRGALLLERFHRVVDGDLQVIEKGDANRFRSFPGREGDVVCGICSTFGAPRVVTVCMTADPAPAGLAAEGVPVSEAFLLEVFRRTAEHLFEFFDTVRTRGIPLFVIEGPCRFPGSRAFHGIRLGQAIAVERRYRAYLRGEFARLGIPDITLPAHCVGADGLMLPVYLSTKQDDFVHGNIAFAEVMLRRVYAHVADPDWVDALRRSVTGVADARR